MPFKCAFEIESDTKYLAPLRQWLGAAIRLSGNGNIRRRVEMECQLALVEAVDNAIFHAHGRDRKKRIGVAIEVDSGGLAIEVSDEGRGIERHAEFRPESMVTHGRGLYLIHRLMHKVESRVANGRHTLKMDYYL